MNDFESLPTIKIIILSVQAHWYVVETWNLENMS